MCGVLLSQDSFLTFKVSGVNWREGSSLARLAGDSNMSIEEPNNVHESNPSIFRHMFDEIGTHG